MTSDMAYIVHVPIEVSCTIGPQLQYIQLLYILDEERYVIMDMGSMPFGKYQYAGDKDRKTI